MPYTLPTAREIVDPRSGRPASAMRADPFSQRELVTASLLGVPRRRPQRVLREHAVAQEQASV